MIVRARPWLLLGWITLTIALTGLQPRPAHAATGDQIDTLTVSYTLNDDGSLRVDERIVLRFGPNSGRHGLERWLVTREPYDDDEDLIFEITDPTVTSPDDVSTTTTVQRDLGEGRTQSMRVRVGDPRRTIFEPTATYDLSYTVRGAMRTFPGYDELYWDVTGTQFPRVVTASVTVNVPGGVQEVFCSAGPVGADDPCPTRLIDQGVGRFVATTIAAGNPLTIAAKLRSRLTRGGPILVESADVTQQRHERVALAGGGLVALVTPLFGWWYYRRNGYDRRFDGLPAGVVPASGEAVEEVPDPGVEVPVALAPPSVPLVEAGLLLDGRPNPRHTAATLVGLAIDGAIRLRGGDHPQARLVDSRRARDRPSVVLLEELFDGGVTVAALNSPGLLAEGHDRIVAVARQRADADGWFIRANPARSAGTSVIAALAVGYVAFLFLGAMAWYLVPVLVSVVLTLAVVRHKLRRGQRTGLGRALTDQVEGFRRHLATVEADELRGAEGDDIFSRYLPWAILFDLTERWTTLCRQLVADGRLPDVAPTGYDGATWNLSDVPGQVSGLTALVASSPSTRDPGGGSG
ncbi:DUF2207 domain-containing protein [Micropruina glycogenica]|uniref:Predicted membrane protein n=1 Tax=Micropruina glycogenica TaxID=75385 RepID=A0A2N9JDX0_9ACTN|nr:DUF2207 domain-containing protein [Micropruina glycogenica]SPD86311.1 Predicted membrane protein [Micropruina glycogenica]